MPLDFTSLNAEQWTHLPRDRTVFFFPVGPLEDHGPHLPVGADLFEARRCCEILAKKTERDLPGWISVILPAAPLGIDANTTELRVTVRPHVLRDWLVDCCKSLRKQGFRNFVCWSGQMGPKQLTAIEEAGVMISGRPWERWWPWGLIFEKLRGPRGTLVSACSALVRPGSVWESPFWPDPKEHGGARDTAVALAVAPDLVSAQYAALPIREKPGRSRSAWGRIGAKFYRKKSSGYWGKPAGASEWKGEEILEAAVNEIFQSLRAVWSGVHPDRLFRSYYSVLLPNRSFFLAWMLAAAVMGLVIAWLYIAITLSAIE